MRQHLMTPFGRSPRGGLSAVWPAVVAERAEPVQRVARPRRRILKPVHVAVQYRSEAYAGEAALRDLEAFRGNARETSRIVARYFALRVLIRGAEGVIAGSVLEAERREVAPYLSLLGDGDVERRALSVALATVGPAAPRRLAGALLGAAVAAVAAGQPNGAERLSLLAYETSRRRGWRREAGRAARALARGATARGDVREARRWQRRARALERMEE